MLAPVHPTCISEGQVLNDPRKSNIRDLDGQVDVGGHQTESMDFLPVPLNTLLHQ